MVKNQKFYKGNAFKGTVYYAPRNNGPANLIGYTPVSKILDSYGNRQTAILCQISEDGLSIDVAFDKDQTAKLAKGMAQWNIYFEHPQTPLSSFSTEIFEFEVVDNPSI